MTIVDPHTNKNVGPTSGAPTIAATWTVTPNSALTLTSGQRSAWHGGSCGA